VKSRVVFVFAILFLSATDLFALDCSRRAAIWTQTWMTVRERFTFADDSARRKWETQFDSTMQELTNASTDVEFWRGLRLRIAELGDGGTTVNFPTVLPQEYDTVPLRIQVAGDRLLVKRMSSSPELARSGVCVGDELLSVNGVAASEWLSREALPHVSGSTREGRIARAAERIFSGTAGTTVELQFRRPDGSTYPTTLTRDSGARNVFFREMYDSEAVTSRLIEGKYLYVNFGRTISANSVEQAERLLDENLSTIALILDLRETSQGVLPRSLISRLAYFPLPSGPYREIVRETRYDSSSGQIIHGLHLTDIPEEMIPPRPPIFRGTVIALVGATTSGAAEQFLQPLVFAQRMILVGETTAGAGGLVHTLDFGNGAAVEITVREPNWENGYGNHCGFPADIAAVPTASGLAADRDEVLEAALDLLNTPSE